VYDAFGRRQRKTIDDVIIDFVYDGLNPVRQAIGSNTVDLLTGPGIDEYFTRADSSSTRELFTDVLGSSLSLADSSGTPQTEYSYEPFGATVASGSSSTNELRYTGREEDGTGVQYYRARYYSPRLQRFLSEDPIGFAGGAANLYEYARNAPTVYVDPLGLFPDNGASGMVAGAFAGPGGWGAPSGPGAGGVSGRSCGVGGAPTVHRSPVIYAAVAVDDAMLLYGLAVASAAMFKLYQDWYFGRGIFASDPRKQQKADDRDPMGDNVRENKQAHDAARGAGLDREGQRELHDEITGRGLSYDEILRIAREIAARRKR
jgi:RHS repeat-associated protein